MCSVQSLLPDNTEGDHLWVQIGSEDVRPLGQGEMLSYIPAPPLAYLHPLLEKLPSSEQLRVDALITKGEHFFLVAGLVKFLHCSMRALPWVDAAALQEHNMYSFKQIKPGGHLEVSF